MRAVTTLVTVFFLCMAYSGSTSGAQARASEKARTKPTFKEYRNKNYNFSFKYPATWSLYQGFDRNGVNVSPYQKSSPFQTAIGVGGSVGQPSDTDETRSRTLEEDFDFGLLAMKEGKGGFAVRNLRIIDKRSLTIQGLPAIANTVEFESGSSNEQYVLKRILIHTRDDSVTYHLSLQCKPEELQALSEIFDIVVRTFRILGPPA